MDGHVTEAAPQAAPSRGVDLNHIWQHLSPGMRFIFSTSGSQESITSHNKGLEALGVGDEIAYLSMSHPIGAQQYAGLLRSPLAVGGAVTGQGLKVEIVPLLNEVEPQAKAMGAVNTVVNHTGLLYGYNTDAFGLEQALTKHLELSGIELRKAIIYGNGGVSGVAAHVVRKLGGEATMIGRDPDHVAQKMEQLGLPHLDGPFDLLINATPISSEPIDQAIGLLPVLRGGVRMVFDHCMPEKKGKRNLLELFCGDQGIYFAPGRDMYEPQMKKQWTLFFNGLSDLHGRAYRVSEPDIERCWGLGQ